MVQEAMQGHGASIQNTIGMGSSHSRSGAPNLGTGIGANLSARELAAREHYVDPGSSNPNLTVNENGFRENRAKEVNNDAKLPFYYNNYDGIPAPYAAPSALKEKMVMKSAIREAAGKENNAPNVMRTDPITDDEVAYLKAMKDQTELAKFDEYVETLIDPKQPGNMKWLMEVYPDYVERRLQQAHTDHEFALRNQMLDSWGINTFEDLHFKYLVDQKKITGPSLKVEVPALDNTYSPGLLSPFNFQSPDNGTRMYMPFASSKVGKRPDNANDWSYDRRNRAMGNGNDLPSLAAGIYDAGVQTSLRGPGLFDAGAPNAGGDGRGLRLFR